MNSIVIPFYQNEASIPELLDELTALSSGHTDPIEVVCVVDGSPDRTFELLERALPRMPFESQLISHSRNYGSFAAIRTGLAAARGDFFAVMAADLQEPPQLIASFFEILQAGEAEVVVGIREGRDDPIVTRLTSSIFWWMYRRLVIPEVPPGGVDVFGCNRAFRSELLQLEERESSLVGLVFWLGFRRTSVTYRRRARRHGRSAWTYGKRMRYLMNSIFAFSDLPIRILIAAGMLGLAVSVGLGLVIVALRATGAMREVPGYAATMTAVLFFGALNTMSIGIVGAYVWRAFVNSQRRPLAVVMRSLRFAPEPSKGQTSQGTG